MSTAKDHLDKFREERIAREKARIDKLRELNLKKYKSNESELSKPSSNIPIRKSAKELTANGLKPNIGNKPSKIAVKMDKVYGKLDQIANGTADKHPTTAVAKTAANANGVNVKKSTTSIAKNETNLTKRPFTVPTVRHPIPITTNVKPKTAGFVKPDNNIKVDRKLNKIDVKKVLEKASIALKALPKTDINAKGDNGNLAVSGKSLPVNIDPKMSRKSFAPTLLPKNDMKMSRKSVAVAPRFDNQKPIITVTKPTPKQRQSMVPQNLNKTDVRKSLVPKNLNRFDLRKSMAPQNINKAEPNVDPIRRQSVFERLYQPKVTSKPKLNEVQKLQCDPAFLKKIVKNSELIINKRNTVFQAPKASDKPIRRSISAVHFKRINKSEINNCIHKWSSIGEKLDKVSVKDIDEDSNIKQDKIVSAIKSERKRVKFQTPAYNFNTPRPEELQSRLQNWLKKRGKSLDSYHHLQCFGIHHMAQKELKPLNLERAKFEPQVLDPEAVQINRTETTEDDGDHFESFNDENKENEPLDSDSDNGSYTENMNDRAEDFLCVKHDWRKASFLSETDMNDTGLTQDTTLTSVEPELVHHVDELLIGALGDLAELLKDGFDWEQSARWLRAIRERFPNASDSAAYWECRAALEERRGDLPASVQCWEEAIAKGSEATIVEANLDQLLDKFMQLKISPNSGRSRQPDPKMVDVKNVFKSTLIRFAVQQAKLRQSEGPNFGPNYTVTPVRRSARISAHWSGNKAQSARKTKTPLRVCTSVRQARQSMHGHPVTFVPNDKLVGTP